jgi:hypothetical protein
MAPKALALPLALLLPLAGCVSTADLQPAAAPAGDTPLVLPASEAWQAFHTTEAIAERLHAWAAEHPDLVTVRGLGQSIQGRDLWAAVLTEGPVGDKPAALIDGGHHANELEGIEMVLYTGDFLLANLGNSTVRDILRTTQVVLVPLVNPDGHANPEGRTRGNALGVNLNRNYDIDWGNPLGANSAVMGTLAHQTGQPMPSVTIVAENAGDAPFSEPEARAMRDLMEDLGPRLAFYLTGHTNAHSVAVPWAAQDPPFRIPPEHEAVFQHELAWIQEHTEYLAGRAQWGNLSAGLPYSPSGSSADYAYQMWRIPSATFEQAFGPTAVLTENYAERMASDDPGLEYWMKAGLPVVWHWLLNARELQDWQLPERDVPLPEGVPPEPPAGMDGAGCICPD